jgi:hypothetical protein
MASRPKKRAAVQPTKPVLRRRIDEILRIRLDGAERWDVCEYVREKEKEEGSVWFLAPGQEPLSDSSLWRYISHAEKAIQQSTDQGRKVMRKNHVAKRRNIYAKAVLSADYRTALACLDSEAKLLGLYPSSKIEVTDERDDAPAGQLPTLEWLGEVLAPYSEAKTAVGAALQALIDQGKAEQLGAK